MNASMSILLSSLSVIVFELIFDCKLSVLVFVWNAASVADDLSAALPTVGFGDADRTFCVPSWKKIDFIWLNESGRLSEHVPHDPFP